MLSTQRVGPFIRTIQVRLPYHILRVSHARPHRKKRDERKTSAKGNNERERKPPATPLTFPSLLLSPVRSSFSFFRSSPLTDAVHYFFWPSRLPTILMCPYRKYQLSAEPSRRRLCFPSLAFLFCFNQSTLRRSLVKTPLCNVTWFSLIVFKETPVNDGGCDIIWLFDVLFVSVFKMLRFNSLSLDSESFLNTRLFKHPF